MPVAALEPVRVTLTYRLGEVTLFERVLEGLADRRHFTRMEVSRGLPALPGDAARADFYFFPCYPVESPPPLIVRPDGWIFYTPYSFKNYFVDLRRFKSFDQYLEATFSSKSRSTLRRKVRKLAEANDGKVDWRIFRNADEMAEFLRLALPLSARTYQERLLGAGLPQSPDFAGHLRDRAALGRVLGYLLFDAGKPLAYVLCFVTDDIATYDYVGFDPSAHAQSPGTVLQYLILESMFAESDVSIFDFTEGEGAQKEFFATDHRFCAKTYVLRATAGGLATVRAHVWTNRVSTVVGDLLDRWHLKQRVRKFLRRAA